MYLEVCLNTLNFRVQFWSFRVWLSDVQVITPSVLPAPGGLLASAEPRKCPSQMGGQDLAGQFKTDHIPLLVRFSLSYSTFVQVCSTIDLYPVIQNGFSS